MRRFRVPLLVVFCVLVAAPAAFSFSSKGGEEPGPGPAGEAGRGPDEALPPLRADNASNGQTGIGLPDRGGNDETAPGAGSPPAAPPAGGSESGDVAAPSEAGGTAPGTAAGVPPGALAEEPGAEAPPRIADPIEPVNRALFVFNDRFYFWLLKPVARGYRAVVPEKARVSVRNFFTNVTTPIRFVSSLLQGKFKKSGTEIARLVINSTIGIGGLFDPARNRFGIPLSDEDLGQTFGRYGLGHGFYLVLPILGPSSLRDATGSVGNGFLDPVNYVGTWYTVMAVQAGRTVNSTSLVIGEYEDIKEAAIDPYVAFRDAYVQYRKKQVEE